MDCPVYDFDADEAVYTLVGFSKGTPSSFREPFSAKLFWNIKAPSRFLGVDDDDVVAGGFESVAGASCLLGQAHGSSSSWRFSSSQAVSSALATKSRGVLSSELQACGLIPGTCPSGNHEACSASCA